MIVVREDRQGFEQGLFGVNGTRLKAGACCSCTGVGGARVGSDLDEGYCSSGLCNAGTQLIHAVLHSAQDFGLLCLWMTLCEYGVYQASALHQGPRTCQGEERGDWGVGLWVVIIFHNMPEVPPAQADSIPECLLGDQADCGCVCFPQDQWGQYRAILDFNVAQSYLRISSSGEEV
jgi:hypothetical protein